MNQKFIIAGLIVLQLIMVRQTKAADSKPVWNFGDGTYGTGTTTTHYYAVPKVYSVTLTVYSLDNHGEICECKEKITKEVKAEGCEGNRSKMAKAKGNSPFSKVDVKETKSNIVLTTTPNPFNQTLTISVKTSKENKEPKQPYSLSLLTANGSTVSTQSISANSALEINTGTYPAGMYFLTLKGNDGVTLSTQVVKVNQ